MHGPAHHHHQPGPEQGAARYAATRQVTLVGALINVLLAVAKVTIGVIGRSHALVADGVHSLSDLVSDVVVLYAARLGSRHADDRHPYGHARIETVATVVVGVLLISVAAGIAIDAMERLLSPERLLHPGAITLGVAVLSVLAKEALYHYTMRVADRIRSNLLKANAWHHRSDAISSLVVIIGIGGTLAGFEYLDAVASIIVALMIAKAGWDLTVQSVHELVDTGLDEERLVTIRDEILAIDGVSAMHQLRTRRMGADAFVDVHILIDDPTISVSEGHQLSETVRWTLIRNLDEVSDVTVHIDPEDDEVASPSADLPLRGEVVARLREQWRDIEHAEAVRDIQLHYLDGRIRVIAVLPLAAVASLEAARAMAVALSERAERLDEVGEAHIRFE